MDVPGSLKIIPAGGDKLRGILFGDVRLWIVLFRV